MDDEFFIMVVVVTAIIAGTWAIVSVVRLVASYLQGRHTDPTLTTSELAGVIGRAVEDAVKPLEEKIDRLERQQRRLAESRPEQLEK